MKWEKSDGKFAPLLIKSWNCGVLLTDQRTVAPSEFFHRVGQIGTLKILGVAHQNKKAIISGYHYTVVVNRSVENYQKDWRKCQLMDSTLVYCVKIKSGLPGWLCIRDEMHNFHCYNLSSVLASGVASKFMGGHGPLAAPLSEDCRRSIYCLPVEMLQYHVSVFHFLINNLHQSINNQS